MKGTTLNFSENCLDGGGHYTFGSDFDEKTIAYLNKRFCNPAFEVKQEDAFQFTFNDKSFDLVFHNGFWIYFENDDKIKRLLFEQVRITKKTVVVLVHNADNKSLVSDFRERSKTDPLYKIRFFHRHELVKLVKESGISFRNLSIEKFGGFVDCLFAIERKMPALQKLFRWLIPRLYRFQSWKNVERIALIVELE